MTLDRVRQIRIRNFRTLADVTLDLDGLSVVIGEAGSGKSTLIEACEILRLSTNTEFVSHLIRRHGALGAGLLRFGQEGLALTARIGGAPGAPDIEYSIGLINEGGQTVIEGEKLITFDPKDMVILLRDLSSTEIWEGPGGLAKAAGAHPGRPLLSLYGAQPQPVHPALKRAHTALSQIDVQPPFRVEPIWVADGPTRGVARLPSVLERAERLEPLARNLASAFHSLLTEYGEQHRQETLEIVRLGLGDDVESVMTPVYEAPGSVTLSVKFKQFGVVVPAWSLSDGQIAWLAFVALNRLETRRSLLAFDEPDLHLHPRLLMRLLDLFDRTAQECPVLITTHSDRLLDGLDDPANSVIVCELDNDRATRLRRPNSAILDSWLKRYRGLGEIRAEGHLESVMSVDESSKART